MRPIRKLKTWGRVLTTPTCWLRNYRANKDWDAALNRLLDNPTFERMTGYTVVINGTKVWIENWAYAYGGPHDAMELLPTRATAFRLRDALAPIQAARLKARYEPITKVAAPKEEWPEYITGTWR